MRRKIHIYRFVKFKRGGIQGWWPVCGAHPPKDDAVLGEQLESQADCKKCKTILA